MLAGIVTLPSLAINPPLQQPCSGNIDRLYVYSPEMADTVTVDVWTPRFYNENPGCRLPVIYMHDGQNLFDASTTWNHQSWEMDSVVTAMIDDGRVSPVMIVGVHSVAATRVADLMPERPFDSIPDIMGQRVKSPLRGNEYAAFFATTLRDSINSRYRTLTDPDNTAVMGSSMGGLMSIYILCEYPGVFGKAACLSTHWIGGTKAYENGDERFAEIMYRYVDSSLPRDKNHLVYFDRGTETIDAFYGKWDDSIINLCIGNGYEPGVQILSYEDKGASHEENAWKRRVDRPLRFLFPTK